MKNRIDLHIHSDHSDGCFSPEKILATAKSRKLRAISITDHDNITGVRQAIQLAPAYGIEVIAGIELSVMHKGKDLHFLGYFIDTDHPDILSYVSFLREERLKRAKKIIEKLVRLGVRICLEEVMRKAGAASIGRVHIADILVEKGYAGHVYQAFDRYIGDYAPAAVPKAKIAPEDAMRMISNSGGLSFIAHPGVDIVPADLSEMAKSGLNGIETIHPRHSSAQQKYYSILASGLVLLESGGSDCHGDRIGNAMIGRLNVPYSFVEAMKAYLEYDYPSLPHPIEEIYEPGRD
ncbi:PHP domain-containing protein [candidate division KSB1 bacterium]|nr:PHP domain-containing protein [candidate division KSB1 bacterium]